MKSKTRKIRSPLKPLQRGQVWQLEDSHLRIELIGKTLVHFKHFKGHVKRSPVSLLNIDALQKFLRDNQAILVQE